MTAAAGELTPRFLDNQIADSKLAAPVRHVFRALAPRCDWATGQIPKDQLLSLTELCHRTGHSRRTVREALFVLQDEGWVSRQPPPEHRSQREHAKTATWVHPPGSPHMLAARGQLTGPDHRARRRMYRDRQHRWQAEVPDWAADPHLTALAMKTLHRVTGRQVDEKTAAAAVTTVLGGHARGYFKVGPARFLTVALENDPRRFLPTPEPPRHRPPAAQPPPGAAAAGAATARALIRDRAPP